MQHLIFLCCWQWHVTQQCSENAFLYFHSSSGLRERVAALRYMCSACLGRNGCVHVVIRRGVSSVEELCTWRHIPEYMDITEMLQTIEKKPLRFVPCPRLQKMQKELSYSETASVSVSGSRRCRCWKKQPVFGTYTVYAGCFHSTCYHLLPRRTGSSNEGACSGGLLQ
jgi:hypothetical protein